MKSVREQLVEGLSKKLDFSAEAEKAAKMSDSELHYALLDIKKSIEPSRELDREDGGNREGYYTDQASVYRAELAKRPKKETEDEPEDRKAQCSSCGRLMEPNRKGLCPSCKTSSWVPPSREETRTVRNQFVVKSIKEVEGIQPNGVITASTAKEGARLFHNWLQNTATEADLGGKHVYLWSPEESKKYGVGSGWSVCWEEGPFEWALSISAGESLYAGEYDDTVESAAKGPFPKGLLGENGKWHGEPYNGYTMGFYED